jgi:hypothetical protein
LLTLSRVQFTLNQFYRSILQERKTKSDPLSMNKQLLHLFLKSQQVVVSLMSFSQLCISQTFDVFYESLDNPLQMTSLNQLLSLHENMVQALQTRLFFKDEEITNKLNRVLQLILNHFETKQDWENSQMSMKSLEWSFMGLRDAMKHVSFSPFVFIK